MFKIIAVVVIGILGGIGFLDIGQEACTLAALLLGIGALLDYSQRKTAAPLSGFPPFLFRSVVKVGIKEMRSRPRIASVQSNRQHHPCAESTI